MHMPRYDTFRFDASLGARLRGLRERVGLTQLALAVAMGRQGKGWHVWVSRLELGKYPNPALALIADYLRACRASISDIADL
ncbi:MAG: helix-turn-helix transcriptional regulator, partial [bacterium]